MPPPLPPSIRATSRLPCITPLSAAASGPFGLNSPLEDVPASYSDTAPERPTQQDDIARGVDILEIGPYLAPKP